MNLEQQCSMLSAFAMCIVIAMVSQPGDCQDTTDESMKNAEVLKMKMYKYLRDMALPKAAKDEIVQQRFVMQIPGKLLDPLDYDASTDSTQSETVQRFDSTIPPKIGENRFRLTDIIPAAASLRGGETGESFLQAYESVLNNMYVRDYNKNTAMYKEASDFLAEKIEDPFNDGSTSRFEMYKRLQKRYDDLSTTMENKIEEKRKELEKDPVSYQIWFQNNYPSMEAEVENAYTEWIVFGQKDLVESYKEKLDIKSTGAILGKAKSFLRASGKPTLDRASTYYPVHFEPSNWYEYLRASPLGPTRDELQIQIGDLSAKIIAIDSIMKSQKTEGEELVKKLEAENTKTKGNVEQKSEELWGVKSKCIANEDDESCKQYRTTDKELGDLTKEYALKTAIVDSTKFQLYVGKESQANLKALKNSLTAKKSNLEKMLQDAKSSDASEFEQKEQAQDFKNGWMEFEFTHDSQSKSEDSSSTTAEESLDVGYNAVAYSASVGESFSYGHSDFSQNIKSRIVKIRGKILKVTVTRPWFNSRLFRNELIKMKGGLKVSPGTNTEKTFIDSITDESNQYMLPEFVSAFMLAKDIEMEFLGVDSKTKGHTLQQSASGRLSGSYLTFSASSSFSYGSTSSSLQTESTADGLKFKIPGAQLIGYYTTLLPCFPYDQNECKKS